MEQAVVEERGKNKRVTWGKKEDVHLAKAFCTIFEDSIIDSDQKDVALWNRDVAYYNEHKPKDLPARTPGVLRSHWYYIKQFVLKFNTCYNSVNETYKSGCSYEDIYKMVVQKYRSGNPTWSLDRMWEIVKDSPSFLPQSDDDYIGTKKTRTFESGASNTSSSQDTIAYFDLNEETRPIGQKAAKRKAKAKGKNTTSGNDEDENNDLKKRYDTIVKGLAEFSSMKKTELEIQKARLEAKKEKMRMKQYEILFENTSNMTPEQLCEEIKAKLKSSS